MTVPLTSFILSRFLHAIPRHYLLRLQTLVTFRDDTRRSKTLSAFFSALLLITCRSAPMLLYLSYSHTSNRCKSARASKPFSPDPPAFYTCHCSNLRTQQRFAPGMQQCEQGLGRRARSSCLQNLRSPYSTAIPHSALGARNGEWCLTHFKLVPKGLVSHRRTRVGLLATAAKANADF